MEKGVVVGFLVVAAEGYGGYVEAWEEGLFYHFQPLLDFILVLDALSQQLFVAGPSYKVVAYCEGVVYDFAVV